ncbi:MAG TPA: protein kinase [Chthoniobacterales bacterium]|nr:protein kinase [Chthoniobacterales bacterium]
MNDTELDLGQTLRGFAPGEKLFGRYTLKAILGRGGMGIVWRAFDEHLERDVALKFLPELIVLDHAALDELKRETKRNLELTHHNIVRIYDFAHEDHTACISMEYVDGATLSALRVEHETKTFKVAELQPLVTQFSHALDYAHVKARIVHRDLKPANLMVNASGQLKITDFGIARSLSDSVSMLSMRSTSGTLLYMSPQQLDGERPSSLDDIYSFGATLYELLTSKPPFFSGAIETQIREKAPASITARRKELSVGTEEIVPREWEETIAKCLAKDPAQRPQSAGELAVRLGLAPGSIESAPVTEESSRPPSAPERPTIEIVQPPIPIIAPPILPPAHRPFPARRVAVLSLSVLAVFGFAALLGLAGKSMLKSFQERSNQEPTAEWARTVPQEKMATSFGQGGLLRFEPKEVTIVRESKGLVHVTLKGAAVTRGALYEGVSSEDPAVLPQSKLAEWRKARERAQFLQQRAGSNVAAIDQKAFQFVRETTPLGKTVEFQFQFIARRDGSDWHLDRVVTADLSPAGALLGKPITEFSSPAILGTDKANRDRTRLIESIDKYVADVGKANAIAIRRFTKEGRDADGNLLFPADRPMPGERFAQTRMRVLRADEAQNWSPDDLQYAMNEVFARHGRRFEDNQVAAVFGKLSWYRPRADLSNQQIEESLSEVEVQNVIMLHSVIVARKEQAERARQAAIAQRQQQEAAQRYQEEVARAQREAAQAQQRAIQAQREAEARAQQEAAAAAIAAGLINAIINRRR